MPGYSLWLVPLEDSDLYKTIHDLTLNRIPSIFPDGNPARFVPHITLTSNVLPGPADQTSQTQDWLDRMTIPDSGSGLKVAIHEVEVDVKFFKKITMRCDKTHELCELAAFCRAAGVEGEDVDQGRLWVEKEYLPHCSLM